MTSVFRERYLAEGLTMSIGFMLSAILVTIKASGSLSDISWLLLSTPFAISCVIVSVILGAIAIAKKETKGVIPIIAIICYFVILVCTFVDWVDSQQEHGWNGRIPWMAVAITPVVIALGVTLIAFAVLNKNKKNASDVVMSVEGCLIFVGGMSMIFLSAFSDAKSQAYKLIHAIFGSVLVLIIVRGILLFLKNGRLRPSYYVSIITFWILCFFAVTLQTYALGEINVFALVVPLFASSCFSLLLSTAIRGEED